MSDDTSDVDSLGYQQEHHDGIRADLPAPETLGGEPQSKAYKGGARGRGGGVSSCG